MLLDLFVTVAPLIGYLSQYKLIQTSQSVGTFSIDICAILLIANLLRIVFWFTNGFAANLFLQSFLIILIQLATLKLCIELGYKKNHEFGFWRWNNFSSFGKFLVIEVTFLIGFILIIGISAFFAMEEKINHFGQLVGLIALSLESTLGVPQIVTNYQNKSTKGLSYFMIFLWTVGDVTKTIYFITQSQPFPFLLCGVIQSIADFIIVFQILHYCNSSSVKIFHLGTQEHDIKLIHI